MVDFELATRQKYRFPYKGSISVEDLWDLSMSALDSVYKSLIKQRKDVQTESLMTTTDNEEVELKNKIDIVQHIFFVKKQEHQDIVDAKANKEKAQKIMSIIEQKKESELVSLSIEELQAELTKLKGR